MTRGMKGCYIYCTDPGMREYIRKRLDSVPKGKPSYVRCRRGQNMPGETFVGSGAMEAGGMGVPASKITRKIELHPTSYHGGTGAFILRFQ